MQFSTVTQKICKPERVPVPNNLVLGFWVVIVRIIIVQVLGKFLVIKYLDPLGNLHFPIMVEIDGPGARLRTSSGVPCVVSWVRSGVFRD